MGLKQTDQCLQQAKDDEWIFVLLARDQFAPTVVLEWVKQSLYDQPDWKLREAFECALKMKNQKMSMIPSSEDWNKKDPNPLTYLRKWPADKIREYALDDAAKNLYSCSFKFLSEHEKKHVEMVAADFILRLHVFQDKIFKHENLNSQADHSNQTHHPES